MGKLIGIALFIANLYGQTPIKCAWEHAVQLHRSGNLPDALREYQVCVSAEPGRVDARSNLGAVLAGLGRYEEAVSQYQAALQIATPDVAPRLRFYLALA